MSEHAQYICRLEEIIAGHVAKIKHLEHDLVECEETIRAMERKQQRIEEAMNGQRFG